MKLALVLAATLALGAASAAVALEPGFEGLEGGGAAARVVLVNGEASTVTPDASSFWPPLDAPGFDNFPSAPRAEGPVIDADDIDGTCAGWVFLTARWFARVVHPVLRGRQPDLQHAYAVPDGSRTDSSCPAYGRSDVAPDAVAFLMSHVTRDPQALAGELVSSSEKLASMRLGPLTRSTLWKEGKLAAVAHHLDQHGIPRVMVDTTNPGKLASAVAELRSRVLSQGSQPVFFHRYCGGFLGFRSFEEGHALLLYGFRDVEVEIDGVGTRGVQLLLLDPDDEVRADDPRFRSLEGTGSYLLYVPEAGVIRVSDAMARRYGLQTEAPFIDGDQTRFGYYDWRDGGAAEADLARTALCQGTVGEGRVLTPEQQARADRTGSVNVGY